MGVRRAVDTAAREAQNVSPVYTLGPLIHNPKVLSELKALGVNALEADKIPNESGCSIIIRAHGISPNLEIALREKDAHIIDATCPNVKANQIKAEELSRAGYCLFLAGEAKHAEIIAIKGYAKSSDNSWCEVVGNSREAGKEAKKLYNINPDVKTALLGQTTISEEEYKSIEDAIRLFFPNLEVIQTICAATKERQNALKELLDHVQAVIIAGGRESANTNRLLEIAIASGKHCVLTQSADEIPAEFYNYETIGLCAGASTPDSVIDEIENKLKGK